MFPSSPGEDESNGTGLLIPVFQSIFPVAALRQYIFKSSLPTKTFPFAPTGEILKVENTPFDFRTPKTVGQDINADNQQIKNGAGYDHCFVLNKKEEDELSFSAKITEPVSGRTMEVYTTEPGVQVYTDNWADGYKGQNGATFPRRSAICFEAQHFPDSPNRPYFPSVTLNPGEQYKQKTIYKFGVKK